MTGIKVQLSEQEASDWTRKLLTSRSGVSVADFARANQQQEGFGTPLSHNGNGMETDRRVNIA